jgi:3-phosphoshikimate 1-carboxyvinyltransferase
VVLVPGDKSITHRAYLLGGLARGVTRVRNPNSGLDAEATLKAIELLGARVSRSGEDEVRSSGDVGPVEVRIEGVAGAPGEPEQVIDCGDSGTTMRLLAGILSGSNGLLSILTGDASLRSRPMGRVIEPLERMGARILSRAEGRAPLVVRGGALRGIDYPMPVASAQVKSALLLAGLRASGRTVVRESVATRDHTERILRAFGVPVAVEVKAASTPRGVAKGSAGKGRVARGKAEGKADGKASERKAGEGKGTAVKTEALEMETEVAVEGGARLTAAEIQVPGDPSAAAFFLVAALILPDSEVVIEGVAMNPTRRGAIDTLIEMGGEIELRGLTDDGLEPSATVVARSSQLAGIEIPEDRIPSLIDELPVLAVAAAYASGSTTVRGAGELRVKESDRIDRICQSLAAAGVRVEERADGFVVHGGPRPHGAAVDALGDHRMAMAMAVLGLGASGPVEIHGAQGIPTSFPDFAGQLASVRSLR